MVLPLETHGSHGHPGSPPAACHGPAVPVPWRLQALGVRRCHQALQAPAAFVAELEARLGLQRRRSEHGGGEVVMVMVGVMVICNGNGNDNGDGYDTMVVVK